MLSIVVSFYSLQVSFTAGSAAFHRRHLMVWKIFAPRYMFEAVSFLLTIPMLLAGLLFFKRVDTAINIWFEKLQKNS
jgi:hypothetical protein